MNRPTVTEVAPDVFRITTLIPDFDLQFSQFLVRDDEPLLYHTGMRALFPGVRDAVKGLIDLQRLRWLAFSHFESDECGSLNMWLEAAPRAEPACGFVGAMVNVNDFADRPPHVLSPDEPLVTGRHRFRYLPTPQVPHAWDAGMLFEETDRSLFCSDILHQSGDVEPFTEDPEVVERFRRTIVQYNDGPFAYYLPYTAQTGPTLDRLIALEPAALLTMHGSVFRGDGAAVLRATRAMMKEVLDTRRE
jgi:flavorubredoxin